MHSIQTEKDPHLLDSQGAEMTIDFTHKGKPYSFSLRDLTPQEEAELDRLRLNSYRRMFRWIVKTAFVGGDAAILTQSDLLDKAAHTLRQILDELRTKPARHDERV